MPKSFLGPPGLCEAVRIIPPLVFLFRIRFETAGVEKIPSLPITSFLSPLAAQILIITLTAWGQR
jgi:hypothetical protein